MPAAGFLADKIGPGKVVLTGLVVDVIGLGMFAFTDEHTGYFYLLGALFVMGLGMGGTMMPIMTSALQTLKDAEIARGSTLMNITQQVAASIGTALFSVLLTNGFNGSAAVTSLRHSIETGARPDLRIVPQAYSDMSHSFAQVFLVATILVALCIVPALMLPRRKPAATSPDGEAVNTAALMH